MNLMEKYKRKFESGEQSVIKVCQIDTAVPISELPKEVKEAYEERAGIMEWEGGLSREEAERQAWCREVCILTAGQRELCERVIPCPKGLPS